MHVALVTVGDEILAGDTVNTNAAWLGQRLAERGVDVERVTVVPDRVEEIARVVSEYRAEYDAVIVTGGLGPTHDDLTLEGVAAALGREVERNEEALAWLTEEGGYERAELTSGTADLPRGARPLHNEAGVAPGAVIEGIYVLPGVPREMKAMFESIEEEFEGEPRHTRFVHTTEPESALVPRLAEVRERFDVTVGSYPGDGVRLKLTGADEGTVEAAADWLRDRVEGDE
ncbi:molybdopterin-binding protein [Halalkalicoccus sp. NIPERK01]|uniref:competence/damage-inducible protein A n=1 Tax=Halalkalicoccus sp. NIPERK01 TaxID=3053469 RepID=UPI00256E9DC5|nr:molybdopterin-binding protein [Halalkalicoccus sp. NIPERK01]MDL5360354.1 molybdopterin-binding protein [Halalkalicoccus sp. NIPERK01]